MRVTPKNIQELKENEIFVFGSNRHGLHYGGAARLANERFGAIIGQANGLQGQSYGIDTMSGLDRLKSCVMAFELFAIDHPELTFYVTAIGTGIAGYTVKQIAPLFKDFLKLENVYLPESFIIALT